MLGEPLRGFHPLASGYPLHHLRRHAHQRCACGSVVPLLSLSQKKRFFNRKFHFTQKNRHLADKTSKNTLI
jgi:hypothetical protein